MSARSDLAGTALDGLEEGRVFDAPFIRLADTARSWQVAFYAALAVIAILVAGLVQQAAHRQVLVHVVEVDPLGRTVYAGPARQAEDPEPYIRHELSEFLIDLRTVVADRRALFRSRSRALVHAARPVRTILDRYFSDPANDPRRLALSVYREVHILSLLPLSESSWQIQWTETETTRAHGRQLSRPSRTAVLQAELVPARKRPSISAQNPLGLYVTNLTWSKTSNELEGDPR